MTKILLVEDDPFIRDIIETKLCAAGYDLDSTADGESVLNRIKDNEPDLVLLDLMLPNKHGFDILEEIRADVELKKLPVIVLSNENGTDVEAKAKSLDAQYFFKAMTDMNELATIVEKTLEKI